MSFTDEDLKKLKENIQLIETYGRWLTNGSKVSALLARLEAAEAVIKDFRIPEDMPMGCIERWLKSKGDSDA